MAQSHSIQMNYINHDIIRLLLLKYLDPKTALSFIKTCKKIYSLLSSKELNDIQGQYIGIVTDPNTIPKYGEDNYYRERCSNKYCNVFQNHVHFSSPNLSFNDNYICPLAKRKCHWCKYVGYNLQVKYHERNCKKGCDICGKRIYTEEEMHEHSTFHRDCYICNKNIKGDRYQHAKTHSSSVEKCFKPGLSNSRR